MRRPNTEFFRLVLFAAGIGVAPTAGQEAPVEVRVPVAPAVVVGVDGRGHLGYELHVTNVYRSTGVLRLERVDVFADSGRAPLFTYDKTALDTRVLHPGADPSVRYARSLDGGMRGIVHIWATLPAGSTAPRTLRHRLLFLDDNAVEHLVDGVPVEIHSAAPIALGVPIRSGRWLVHNGPGNNQSPHWGSVLARNGRLTLPQRFAIDWIGVDENGRAVKGDFQKSANEDWVGIINPRLLKLTLNSEKITPRFFVTAFAQESVMNQVHGMSYGGTMDILSLKVLRTLRIPLPPLATQKAMVAEIEAEEALVAANRELIVRFEKRIQATLARVWGEDEAAPAVA